MRRSDLGVAGGEVGEDGAGRLLGDGADGADDGVGLGRVVGVEEGVEVDGDLELLDVLLGPGVEVLVVEDLLVALCGCGCWCLNVEVGGGRVGVVVFASGNCVLRA